MALNPARIQVPAAGDQQKREPRLGSFAMPLHSPGPEEFTRLQELLTQALKREAEAHRKMKHLYEQLLESRSPRTRSLSDGCSQSGTPDILWDSELSQTSEGSPTPAMIVVSASPALPRKVPSIQPTSVKPLHQVNGSHEHYPKIRDDLPERLTPTSELEAQEQLAPSPQDYRGVRHEREKPPPCISPSSPVSPMSTSPTQIPSSFDPELQSFSSVEERKGRDDDFLTQSMGGIDLNSTIARSTSIKEEKRKKVGMRSRANTGTFLPNWIRRRKGLDPLNSSPSSSSTTRVRQRSPVESIAEMFNRFVNTANTIEPDSLTVFIDHHWSEYCKESACSVDIKKYRDAVWDLFQAETKFLTRFLQPLEQVYKGFLEELHFHGILKVADVDKIFANLSELCELSSSVANDLFKLFEGRSGSRIAPNRELILSFSMFGHKFNPVYQRFCVNFEKQRGFVRALAQIPEFVEYVEVCRRHHTVGKNDLSALLIAPMKHQCHYQLLLEKVLKYTKSKSEKDLLSSAIKAFVVSLKELEANIDENKRSAEMLELQETLCWPTLSQLEPSAYIPETLSSQACLPCAYVLASKDRQLLYNGPLRLLDNGKHSLDVVAFLFTDSILLTRQKNTQADKRGKKESVNQLTRYYVLGHPLLLTSVEIHDIPVHTLHGHLITLVERNAFQQQVGIYSLQTPNKEEKNKWFSRLTHAKNIIYYRNSPSFVESDV